MPHVIIKLYHGRTEEQKKILADAISKSLVDITGCLDRSVSIAVEEFSPDDWAEKVYRPDILEKEASLIRKPGYNPLKD